jgi:hypothetical protein
LARSFDAEVLEFKWDGQYPKKKQWTLNQLKADYEWILLLDADESLSVELVSEVNYVVSGIENQVAAYDCVIDYWFEGKQLKYGQKAVKRILLKPAQAHFPVIDDLQVSNMWEVEGHYQAQLVDGAVGMFKSRLVHFDSDGLFSYLARHNKYSDWEAYVRNNPHVKRVVLGARPVRARLLDRLPFKGLLVFLYGYLVKLGFLDGRAGFDFAANQAFYYWQIRAKELHS